MVVDLDRDGKLDVATANNGANSVSVLRGDGLGGFGAAVGVTVANPIMGAYGIAAGDLNRDGRTDLVVTGFMAVGKVAVLLTTSM